MNPKKIAIIGNIASGKTRLSRKLEERYQFLVTHIDSLQFLPGMKIRPLDETREALKKIEQSATWIIDGYGPLDLLENRLRLADQIILLDWPIWRNYFWLTRRQIINLWSPRKELPPGCSELSWSHSVKLFKTLKKMHQQMRPELLRILSREEFKNKTIYVRNLTEWKNIYSTSK